MRLIEVSILFNLHGDDVDSIYLSSHCSFIVLFIAVNCLVFVAIA